MAEPEEGQAEYPDGSIRWLAGNKQGKKPGTLAKRPPSAAPLFDSALARQLARARHEERREAADTMMLKAAQEASPGELIKLPS